MSEARPQQPQAIRPERAAAAVALILTSQVPQATKTAEIAAILFEVVRQTATIHVETAAKIAKALAVLAVVRILLDRRRETPGGTQSPQGATPGVAPAISPGARDPQGTVQPGERGVRPERAEEDEILRRAMYVVNGSMRMARDIANGRSPDEALERESRHYLAHTEAQQKRRSAKRLREVAREEYGDILSWNHRATRDPKEPREPHEAMDGFSFDASKGPPKATGVYPGVLPWCSCLAGPPRVGAMVVE